MALAKADVKYELREIAIKNKPQHMLEISPKGTVPVLQLTDGTVIDESIDVMFWAMTQNDPDGWLKAPKEETEAFVKECDTVFAMAVTRYKYPDRYDITPEQGRDEAMAYLAKIEEQLSKTGAVLGDSISLADIAILPLIRQFSKVESDWFYKQPDLQATGKWLKNLTDTKLFKKIMEKKPLWVAE